MGVEALGLKLGLLSPGLVTQPPENDLNSRTRKGRVQSPGTWRAQGCPGGAAGPEVFPRAEKGHPRQQQSQVGATSVRGQERGAQVPSGRLGALPESTEGHSLVLSLSSRLLSLTVLPHHACTRMHSHEPMWGAVPPCPSFSPHVPPV